LDVVELEASLGEVAAIEDPFPDVEDVAVPEDGCADVEDPVDVFDEVAAPAVEDSANQVLTP